MDDENLKLKKVIEDFLIDPKPGRSLEIPHVGMLQHLPNRRVNFFKYRTGETISWEILDR